MEITRDWLKKNGACSDSIKLFEKHTITDAGDIVRGLGMGIKATHGLDKQKRLKWANWLLTRALTRKNGIRYAVFTARLVLPIYAGHYPNDSRVIYAIEAAEAVIADDNRATRSTADDAAEAVAGASGTAAYPAYCAAHCAATGMAADDAAAGMACGACPAEWGTTMINILQYGLTLLE